MFYLDGIQGLGISVNGIELDNRTTIGVDLTIKEACNISSPQIGLSLYNDGSIIQNNPLFDKSSIDITIKYSDTEMTMPFHLFNYEHFIHGGEGFRVNISANYKAEDLQSSRIEFSKGNSSEVFKKIARRLGLSLEYDKTRDSQVWIRPGLRGSVWLDQVASHAYYNDVSCFVWCISRYGQIKFYNISKRLKSEPKWIFSNIDPIREDPNDRKIQYTRPVFNSISGTLNAISGYGRESYLIDFTKSQRKSTYEKMKMDKSVINLQLNRNYSKPQKHEPSNVDFGNVHANYFKSHRQNIRLRSLFSSKVTCMVDYYTEIELLDLVNFICYVGGDKNMIEIDSGLYLVSAIETMVSPDTTKIVQKISLIREGINPDNKIKDLV